MRPGSARERSSVSGLGHQTSGFDHPERNLPTTALNLQYDQATFIALKETIQFAASIELFCQPDPHPRSRETLEVIWEHQGSIHTWRRDFEIVLPWQGILDIQHAAQLMTYRSAIIERDSALVINIDPERCATSSALKELHSDKLEPHGFGDPTRQRGEMTVCRLH